MDYRWNPRVFLFAGIGNFVITVMLLVGQIVLLSLGGRASLESIYLTFPGLAFLQISGLAIWQYRAMRVIEEKFKRLEQGFSKKQELLAK